MIELRPYQHEHAGEVREGFLVGYMAILLALATGAGKTVIFSYIALLASQRGKRVLILAHRDALIKQASRKLSQNGVDHGIIMADYTPKPYCNVQVASMQTMARRIAKFKYYFDLVIIDEAHLSACNSYHKILTAILAVNPEARVLGVTGTPCRLDGKGLGRNAGGHFDKLIVGTDIAKLIAMGWLVKPEVYAPSSDSLPDFSGLKKEGIEYNEEQHAAVMDRPTITGRTVDQYRRICNGVPAVAWCVNLKHARNVAAEFNAAGIPAVALSGEEHDGTERDEIMGKLVSGEIKVVTFCKLLVEGVDCPAIGCVILVKHTFSLTDYLQVVGRGLRPDPNNPEKNRCFVLDQTGLTWIHGMADDAREWSLEGAPKRKKKKKDEDKAKKVDIAQCDKCFLVFNRAPVCPGCGHEMPTQARKLQQVEGDLNLVTPEVVAARRKDRNREIHACKTLEQLEDLGKKYGYKDGWAKVKWQFVKRKRKHGQRPPPSDEEKEALMKTYESDPVFARGPSNFQLG